MNNLTIKQKIIIGVIVGIMLIVIGIYGYVSLNNNEDNNIDDSDLSNLIQENLEDNVEFEKNKLVENTNSVANRSN